jgi:hypothetical protein
MNRAVEPAESIEKIVMHFVTRRYIECGELFIFFFLGIRIPARRKEITKTTPAPVMPAAIVDRVGDSIPKKR